jgi:hypothetical protein
LLLSCNPYLVPFFWVWQWHTYSFIKSKKHNRN